MHRIIAAACDTGSFQQKWNCGLHNNVNVPGATVHAASTFPPVAIGVLIVLALIFLVRRSRSGSPATSKS